MPQGKRNTVSNAKRKNVSPKRQDTNGPKKLTRTSTDMVAKAPPGTARHMRIYRVRFG